MADIYLRSTDGSDASDGLTWANAKATLAAALTAAGAGGRVFVSDNHAETQASAMTLTSPGTAASPVQVLCVDDTGDPQPPTTLATTATITTTGNNAISFGAGFAYTYGIIFQCGTGGSSTPINLITGVSWWKFESCSLQLLSTAIGSRINIGVGSTTHNDFGCEWINCTVKFGSTSQAITARSGPFLWQGSGGQALASGSSVPASGIFRPSANGEFNARCIGVDLSQITATLVEAPAGVGNHFFAFTDCKLGSGVAPVTGTITGQAGIRVLVTNCDSTDTNYRYYFQAYQGSIAQETTIVRSGGLSDGTTSYSRKFVSTANSKLYSPLEGQWMYVWNETTGSAITATVPVVTDNVTLTDGDAWIEAEYMGTSGFPLGIFVSDRVANVLASTASQPTDGTSSWTTTGLGTPVKQSLAVTLTPQEKGWIRVRVMLARASTTMYADKPILS